MIGDSTVTCPVDLLERARKRAPLRTAVVNAVNAVVMESVRDAANAGVIEPLLVGEPNAVRAAAEAVGFDISGMEVVDGSGEEGAAASGAQLAASGRAEAVMKGHLHTDVYMRALLQRDAGLRIGRPFTHVSHLTLPGRAGEMIVSDGALNPAPDLELKKAITTNAVAVACALDINRPKVAFLSATEVPNERIPSSMDAVELKAWSAGALPEADCDGPLAFDLAISAEATRIKGIQSPVAGQADVIIVPEIVAGNTLFKSMTMLMNACLAGVVMGAKVPIILTSRADPPAARLASAALASIARGL